MNLVLLRGIYRKSYIAEHSYFVRKFYSSQVSNSKESVKSTEARSSRQPESPETYSSENVRKNIRGYIFSKYMDYVKNYEKILESKFPRAMNVTRIYVVGIKDFCKDIRSLLRIVRVCNGSAQGLRALTRHELETYHQMPKDMKKVAPTLLLLSLPLINYVIFPLTYLYPRQLLTSHFWSIEQRSEFNQIYLGKRLVYNPKVFQCMQSQLENLQNNDNYTKWKNILELLKNGEHPNHKLILDVMDIFTKPPYHVDALTNQYLNCLCGLHGLHKRFGKRFRLSERAYHIHHMDLAIRREGGVEKMSQDTLKHSCFLRGLNPINLSNQEMTHWLNEWIEVSLKVNETNISLLLHLPILISFNQPSNAILVRKD